MSTSKESGKMKSIVFEVLRYDPEKGGVPHLQEFTVPLHKGMTVLDGLHWIKEHEDPTLAWRSSCRMGICGSCGMFINGLPRLACTNQITQLHSDRVVIKPLPNYDIIRDLVPDFDRLFDRHRSVKPYLIGATGSSRTARPGSTSSRRRSCRTTSSSPTASSAASACPPAPRRRHRTTTSGPRP